MVSAANSVTERGIFLFSEFRGLSVKPLGYLFALQSCCFSVRQRRKIQGQQHDSSKT